jgi:WD40 repeat protein
MSSLHVYCSRCGAANDPDGECCHWCKEPLPAQTSMPQVQQQALPRRRMSRRTATLTLVGITAGAIVLPVSAVAAYLTYQRLIDPHILTYSGHEGTVVDAAWSPDGTRVASAGWSNGGTVQIWNATTGETLQTCKLEYALEGVSPLDVVWSADGKQVLAFVGLNEIGIMTPPPGSRFVEMVQVWDAATGQRVRSILVTQPLTAVPMQSADWQRDWSGQSIVATWALNERYLVAEKQRQDAENISYEGVEIWEIASGKKVATLDMDGQSSARQRHIMAWTPDSRKLALLRAGSMLCEIWEIETGSKLATLDAGGQGSAMPTMGEHHLQKMVWAPDSRKLALLIEESVEKRYICEIWDAPAGKKLQTFTLRNMPVPIAWSPNGRSIAIGTRVYDMQTGHIVTTYPVEEIVEALAWSPDGRRVAVSSYTGGHWSLYSYLYMFDVSSGRQLAQYEESGDGVKQLAWSPDGKYILRMKDNIEIWRAKK